MAISNYQFDGNKSSQADERYQAFHSWPAYFPPFTSRTMMTCYMWFSSSLIAFIAQACGIQHTNGAIIFEWYAIIFEFPVSPQFHIYNHLITSQHLILQQKPHSSSSLGETWNYLTRTVQLIIYLWYLDATGHSFLNIHGLCLFQNQHCNGCSSFGRPEF